ncbi:MAG: glycine cleavage system protein H [Desulfobacterales bacterium]|nr:glycine cleavage system protein H [Deltaproteobacteria bacterium]NNL43240.1 glycine cleavage system protein H [Desulfobacterales bacterium]
MKATPMDNRFKKKSSPCIWMQAGIVDCKFCESDYLCSACRFDRALRRAAEKNQKLKKSGKTPKGKKGKIVFWKEKLKELPVWKRPCLHHMKRRIGFRACTNEYLCGNCEFDQYFDDQYAVHAVVKPVDVLDIDGFKIPQGFYLHKGHTWVKIEKDQTVRVGLDDFALRMLGPLDRIEAPLMGKEVKQDRPDIIINRDKREAKVLSPVSGVVTDINPTLREKGNLANKHPYSKGWVLRIHSSNLRDDIRRLMISGETKDFLKQEVNHLYQVIEQTVPLAADGGHLGDDIYGKMPQIGWRKLTKLFLHT